jgi:hypothetical protein
MIIQAIKKAECKILDCLFVMGLFLRKQTLLALAPQLGLGAVLWCIVTTRYEAAYEWPLSLLYRFLLRVLLESYEYHAELSLHSHHELIPSLSSSSYSLYY